LFRSDRRPLRRNADQGQEGRRRGLRREAEEDDQGQGRPQLPGEGLMGRRRQRGVFVKAGVAVLLLSLVALAAVAGSPARSVAVEPKPWGADWTADARVLRGVSGSRFEFICPAKGRLD